MGGSYDGDSTNPIYHGQLLPVAGIKGRSVRIVVFLISLWSNSQSGPARDLTLPLIFLAGGIVIYALIDLYDRRNFGQVEQNRKEYWMDVLFSILFSCFALAAFFLDMSGKTPVSIFALVFSVGLLLDHLLMLRRAGLHSVSVFSAAFAVILLLSVTALLPLLGSDAWTGLGFRSPSFAVYAVDGLLIILFGILGHNRLGASMAGAKEV
jgi:hypothetical protein